MVKWDFVTVEFEEIGEGLVDGLKLGKFGSLLLVEELVGVGQRLDDLEFGWIVFFFGYFKNKNKFLEFKIWIID